MTFFTRQAGELVFFRSMNTSIYENNCPQQLPKKARGEDPEHDTLVLVKKDHCWRNISFQFRYWSAQQLLKPVEYIMAKVNAWRIIHKR